MDEHKNINSRMRRGEATNQPLTEVLSKIGNKQCSNYQTLCEDSFPSVDEDDDLDDEVRSCLVGLPSYKSDVDHSSSPDSSLYSICTQPDSSSQVDNMSTSRLYNSGTLRGVDTDTASYFSVDTLRGSEQDEVQEEKVQVEEVQEEQVEDKSFPQSFGTSNSRPSYLAGSRVSVTTNSSSSLVREGEVSFSENRHRLGKLLGYVGQGADSNQAEDAITSIVGYEIVSKEKEKFTVYKIRVSCPSAVLGTWFMHKRYSDFFQLRKTLMKENPKIASKLSFPPKRWVGSNLEPSFLGRRLAGIQVFLASVLEIRDLKSNPALVDFLCLDKPPVTVNYLEANRAICDTLEEAVQEIREQLRKREHLEIELEHQKKTNVEKDQQIENICKENKLLRQQKESLMHVLSSGRKNNSSTDLRLDRTKSRIVTLLDFTVKFNLNNLKSGEGPIARSTPSKRSQDGQTGLRPRRTRIYSLGEVLPGEDPPHGNEKI